MSPALLTFLVLTAVCAVGFTIGVAIGKASITRQRTGASADETFEAGRVLGEEQGWRTARTVVSIALSEFPTSLGGRAIARAVGVEVPPLPRYAKPPASAPAVLPPLTLTGDGPE